MLALLPVPFDGAPVVIEPGDVYGRVLALERQAETLYWLVGLLCLLVALQIVFKFVIFGRVLRVLSRVEALLVLVEKHGTLTDSRAAEIKTTTLEAAAAVRAAVSSTAEEIKTVVPPRVVEEIAKGAPDSGVLQAPKLGGAP